MERRLFFSSSPFPFVSGKVTQMAYQKKEPQIQNYQETAEIPAAPHSNDRPAQVLETLIPTG
ncbi:hypothetical protein [Enterococcus canintestini]|uniref:hypothetical protein n=1 Tax=Enterococcus canintestini TaxID=317010 RepID=UPI0028A0B743|nr:hypothetical protein [Enterococcus canintestini]